MKQPNTTKITENNATRFLHDWLRGNKIKKFSNKEKGLEDRIFKYFASQLGEKLIKENFKYYKYILGHAKKRLRKDGFLNNQDGIYKVVNITKSPSEKIEGDSYKWNTEITIKNVFEFIGNNRYLLPSFQRGTAWTAQKDYKELALSIYRNIPVGVMYFWKINKDLATNVGHYYFKKDIEKGTNLTFEEVNINEYKHESIFSIIDGQQRITGVNVIVNGTFNGKKMHFNEEGVGVDMFAFKSDSDHKWKSMHEIFYKLKETDINNEESLKKVSEELDISDFSLRMLYKGFFRSNLISVCEMEGGDLLRILEVFIRINNFGKKLKPADLMLSTLVGHNENSNFSIRGEVNELWGTFKKLKPNFSFSSLLKMMAIFFTGEAKINHNTFEEKNQELSPNFYWNKKGWSNLKRSTKYTIEAINELGIKGSEIKSDNSLIPIIYWHSRNAKSKILNDDIKHNIHTYLIFSHLFKHFSSSTDSKLTKLISDIYSDDKFENWKIFEDITEINEETIIEEIRQWEYPKDNEKIKSILSLNPHTLKGSNSIEHIKPQSKKGSDKMFNLAYMPAVANSIASDKDIESKIKDLSSEYSKTEEEIKRALIINLDKEQRLKEIADFVAEKLHNKKG